MANTVSELLHDGELSDLFLLPEDPPESAWRDPISSRRASPISVYEALVAASSATLYFSLLPVAIRGMVDWYLALDGWRTCGQLTPLPVVVSETTSKFATFKTMEPVLIRRTRVRDEKLSSAQQMWLTEVVRYWLPKSDPRFLVRMDGYADVVAQPGSDACLLLHLPDSLRLCTLRGQLLAEFQVPAKNVLMVHGARWLQTDRTLRDLWNLSRAPIEVPESLAPIEVFDVSWRGTEERVATFTDDLLIIDITSPSPTVVCRVVKAQTADIRTCGDCVAREIYCHHSGRLLALLPPGEFTSENACGDVLIFCSPSDRRQLFYRYGDTRLTAEVYRPAYSVSQLNRGVVTCYQLEDGSSLLVDDVRGGVWRTPGSATVLKHPYGDFVLYNTNVKTAREVHMAELVAPDLLERLTGPVNVTRLSLISGNPGLVIDIVSHPPYPPLVEVRAQRGGPGALLHVPPGSFQHLCEP